MCFNPAYNKLITISTLSTLFDHKIRTILTPTISLYLTYARERVPARCCLEQRRCASLFDHKIRTILSPTISLYLTYARGGFPAAQNFFRAD